MTRFLRRYGVRVVILLVLIAAAYGAIQGYGVYVAYHREQAVGKTVEKAGGFVSFRNMSPSWWPASVQKHLPYFTRIEFITLNHDDVPPEVAENLGLLTGIRNLVLDNTNVSDVDMAHVGKLSTLKRLSLDSTQITDAGAILLKELRNLKRLDIASDGITAETRAALRKALPDCEINPDP